MEKRPVTAAGLQALPKTLLEKYHGPLFMAVVLLVGLMSRRYFLFFLSGDMETFLIPWMEEIRANGGVWALADPPGNYTPPYIICMVIASYLPLAPLHAVKAINIAGDVFLAVSVYLLLRQLTGDKTKARFGFAIVFMLPTVIYNSTAWGQCDAIYTGMLVFMLWFYLRDKPWAAMAMFGAAVAFKQQALFLAPLVALLVVLGRVRLRALLAALGAYVAFFLPSIFMGQPVSMLWKVYAEQASLYDFAVAFNVSNLYTWVSVEAPDWMRQANKGFMPGYLLFGLCVIGIFCYWLWLHRRDITPTALFYAAVMLSILVPYALPKMHDRYFFMADVLSVAFALMVPKRWYVPVLCQLASLASYVFYMFHYRIALPLEYAALLPLVAMAAVGFTLRDTLVASRTQRLAEQPEPGEENPL